jgi:hypothetical protein
MKYFIKTVVLTSTLLSAHTLTVVDDGEIEKSDKILNAPILKNSTQLDKKEYQDVTIKDAGVVYSMRVKKPKKENMIHASKASIKSTTNKLNSKVGLIIDFTDTDIDMQTFIIRFNLQLKTKMAIGYYIFNNHSNLTDILLIEKILQSDMKDKIKTIRPNWLMDVVAF